MASSSSSSMPFFAASYEAPSAGFGLRSRHRRQVHTAVNCGIIEQYECLVRVWSAGIRLPTRLGGSGPDRVLGEMH